MVQARPIATILVAAATLLCANAPAGAQEQQPAGYLQFSGYMSGMGALFAGTIDGSLYNSHSAKSIRVTEVTIASSAGRRVFRVDYVVVPQAMTKIHFDSGLYLDFRDKDKTWWTLSVTGASWHNIFEQPPTR